MTIDIQPEGLVGVTPDDKTIATRLPQQRKTLAMMRFSTQQYAEVHAILSQVSTVEEGLLKIYNFIAGQKARTISDTQRLIASEKQRLKADPTLLGHVHTMLTLYRTRLGDLDDGDMHYRTFYLDCIHAQMPDVYRRFSVDSGLKEYHSINDFAAHLCQQINTVPVVDVAAADCFPPSSQRGGKSRARGRGAKGRGKGRGSSGKVSKPMSCYTCGLSCSSLHDLVVHKQSTKCSSKFRAAKSTCGLCGSNDHCTEWCRANGSAQKSSRKGSKGGSTHQASHSDSDDDVDFFAMNAERDVAQSSRADGASKLLWDSCCWHHAVGDANILDNVRPVPLHMRASTTTASGSKSTASMMGDLVVQFTDKLGKLFTVKFSDVHIHDDWPDNRILLSPGQIRQKMNEDGQRRFHWDFENSILTFFQSNGSRAVSTSDHNCTTELYGTILSGKGDISVANRIPPTSNTGSSAVNNTNNNTWADVVRSTTPSLPPKPSSLTSKVSSKLLHLRFGCCGKRALNDTVKNTRGVELTDKPSDLPTPMSIFTLFGKATRLPKNKQQSDPEFSAQRNLETKEYDTLHVDVHGPYKRCIFGYRYYVSFTTSTHMTKVVLTKSITSDDLIRGFKEVLLGYGTPREIRTDRNTTLVSSHPGLYTKFEEFCLEKGIALKISSPQHHDENGTAEKAGGRDLYEAATCRLKTANLPSEFWSMAVVQSAMARNREGRAHLKGKTPFELHFGIKPWIGDIRVFGCPAFVTRDKSQRGANGAFRSRVFVGINLGWQPQSKHGCYMIYNLKTKRVINTPDVFFDEAFEFVQRTSDGWVVDSARLNANHHLLDSVNGTDLKVSYKNHLREQQSLNKTRQSSHDLDSSDSGSDSDSNSESSYSLLKQGVPSPPPPSRSSTSTRQPRVNSVVSTVNPLDSAVPPLRSAKSKHITSTWSSTTPIQYQQTNPKKDPSKSYDRYHLYKQAATVGQFLSLGGTVRDLAFDYDRGYVTTPPSAASPAAPAPAPVLSADIGDALMSIGMMMSDDHLACSYERAEPSLATDGRKTFFAQRFQRINNFFGDVVNGMLPNWDAAIKQVKSLRPARMSLSSFTGALSFDWSRIDRSTRKFSATYGKNATLSAYKKELDGIVAAGVFSELMDLPPGARALQLLTVWKAKVDGRLKCRVCVDGSKQRPGSDFDPSTLYAPVMDRVSHKVLLALGAALCAHIHTMDITQAFLYGDMDEDVYVRPPPGVCHGGKAGQVWKLRKSLYGTKQAPAIWQTKLADTLRELNVHPTKCDPSVFQRQEGEDRIYVGIHVDDLLIVSTSEQMLNDFKTNIKAKFKLRDQGSIHDSEYLGTHTQYDQSKGVLHISNDRKVEQLLSDHGYEQAKPADSPAVVLSDRDNTPATNTHGINLFAFIGSLNYLAHSCRPDILTATSMLSSIKDKLQPTVSDMCDVERVARYLAKPDRRVGITYDKSKFLTFLQAITPIVYVDADHKKDGDCRSRSGQIIFMCGGPIYWRSQLQNSIATSSTHAEIISLSDVCKRVVWIRSLLKELGYDIPPIKIYEDNTAAIGLAEGVAVNERSRHIHVRHMWTRELRGKNLVDLEHIKSQDNIADFFTKKLTVTDQKRFIASMVDSYDV